MWLTERHLKRYNRDLVTSLSTPLQNCQTILEFGAGIGTLAQEWARIRGFMPDCLEIDPRLCAILQERDFITYPTVAAIDKKYAGIYSSNVLEHIEDDVTALRQIHDLLEPNGKCALYVPAMPCLYSDFDRAVGHYRRYNKKELVQKVESAGLTIHSISYADSLGFFAALLVKMFGYKEENGLGSPKSFALYDRYLHPLSRLGDACGMKHLFGKNLLVIAQRNDEPTVSSYNPAKACP